MSVSPKRLPVATAADLMAGYEQGRIEELIDGELIEKEGASFDHGDAQTRAAHTLFPYNRNSGGGGSPGGWWIVSDVLVQLGPDVCRPDVVGWRRERMPERPRTIPVPVTPDWTCEVLSSNRRNDTVRKNHIYHREKVGHYWLIDPEAETLSVHRWHPDGYLLVLAAERGQRVRAEPFDGIEISVGMLFGDDE